MGDQYSDHDDSERLTSPPDSPSHEDDGTEVGMGTLYAIFGGIGGAMMGVMGGGFAGLLAGGVGQHFGGDVGACAATVLIAGLGVFISRGTVKELGSTITWTLLGALLWAAVWVAGAYWLEWRFIETLFPWALGGAIIATLGGSRGFAIQYGLGHQAPHMEPRGKDWYFMLVAMVILIVIGMVCPLRWRPAVAGALGGTLGGAFGGSIFGVCAGQIGRDTIGGVWGAVIGAAVLGAIGAAFGTVRVVNELLPKRPSNPADEAVP